MRPGFYQRNTGNSSYPAQRDTIEESLSKFMISKVLQERGFGRLPSSTETNLREQVKSISTTTTDLSEIRRIEYGPYVARGVKILEAYDRNLPQKEKDLESFTLPCFINNVCFDKALVDLRASVSVMPFSTYTNLGLGVLSHTRLTIELADRTIKQPRGIAEKVLVRIGKFVFPIDFIILDIPKDDDVPLIFLSTTHVKIDVFLPNFDRSRRSRKNSVHSPRNCCYRKDARLDVQRSPLNLSKSMTAILSTTTHLDKMLARCEETNLVLNWEKYHFMVKEGIVLGYKISRKGIKVDKAKIDVIAKLPYLTNVKGVRSFLGYAGFHCRFIKDFSMISKPMTQLLMKDVNFDFSDDCKKAFNKLKEKLTTAPIIISPDWNVPFELMCDASDFAVGAVLGQIIDGKFTPFYYASKTVNDSQAHYTTTEKELLAVVFSSDKFRPYIILSKTIVYTDHSALKYLFNKHDAKPRLIRWVLPLQGFNIEIKDKKGAENLAADHLSRLENPNMRILTEKEIANEFPDKHLMVLKATPEDNEPWHVDYVNYIIRKVIPPKWTAEKKKTVLFSTAKNYFMALNELMELRDRAYENTRIYKEKTKKWHDSRLRGDKNFKTGDKIQSFALFNPNLHMCNAELQIELELFFSLLIIHILHLPAILCAKSDPRASSMIIGAFPALWPLSGEGVDLLVLPLGLFEIRFLALVISDITVVYLSKSSTVIFGVFLGLFFGGEKCWWIGDGSSKVCSNGSGLVSGIGVGVGMDAGIGVGVGVGMDAGIGVGVGMDAGIGVGVGVDVGGGDFTGGDDVDGTGSVDDDG
ncbi:reverse transcriptase domain-containing protein [Tanacetum coccineum]|uniref:RNA-directed DNA polymerase n=1 Tax=Tanacetum coccineum TaxID=301880 RepID=A0ABQ5AXV6_9ASTR